MATRRNPPGRGLGLEHGLANAHIEHRSMAHEMGQQQQEMIKTRTGKSSRSCAPRSLTIAHDARRMALLPWKQNRQSYTLKTQQTKQRVRGDLDQAMVACVSK